MFPSLSSSQIVSGVLLLSLLAGGYPHSLTGGNGGNANGGNGSESGNGGNGVIAGNGASVYDVNASGASHCQSPLIIGAVAGIVAVISIVATCLVLALFLYIKRRRRHAATARARSFGAKISKSYAETSSSNEDRDGDRGEPEMREGARTGANSPLPVTRSSSIVSHAQVPLAPPSHSHRGDVNGAFTGEGLLQEPRNGNRTVSASAGGRNGNGQTEMEATIEEPISSVHALLYGEQHGGLRHERDGGARSVGGRPYGSDSVARDDLDRHSTSHGSALPPPSYTSHFGET